MAWLVLGVLAVVWGGILIPPHLHHRYDVKQAVEREERKLRALGHAAGWDGRDDRQTTLVPHLRRLQRPRDVGARPEGRDRADESWPVVAARPRSADAG